MGKEERGRQGEEVAQGTEATEVKAGRERQCGVKGRGHSSNPDTECGLGPEP